MTYWTVSGTDGSDCLAPSANMITQPVSELYSSQGRLGVGGTTKCGAGGSPLISFNHVIDPSALSLSPAVLFCRSATLTLTIILTVQ